MEFCRARQSGMILVLEQGLLWPGASTSDFFAATFVARV